MNAPDSVAQLQRSVSLWQRMTFLSVAVALASIGMSAVSLSRSAPQKPAEPAELKVKSLELVGGKGDSVMFTVDDAEADGYSNLVIRHAADTQQKGPVVELSLSQKSGFAHVAAKASNYEVWHQSYAQLVAGPRSSAVEAQAELTNSQLSAIAYEDGAMGLAALVLRNSPRNANGSPARGKPPRLIAAIKGSEASVTKDIDGVTSELVASPR